MATVQTNWRIVNWKRLNKQKHPMSPLTSSAGDEQTVTRIERKKKGQRLVFDHKCPGQISVTDTSKEIIQA
mgnify:CR=1 FL=1